MDESLIRKAIKAIVMGSIFGTVQKNTFSTVNFWETLDTTSDHIIRAAFDGVENRWAKGDPVKDVP